MDFQKVKLNLIKLLLLIKNFVRKNRNLVNKVQGVSGGIVGLFLLAHFVALFNAIIGKKANEIVMKSTRKIYQKWFIEIALLIALIVHCLAAIMKFIYRQKIPKTKTKYVVISSSAGDDDKIEKDKENQKKSVSFFQQIMNIISSLDFRDQKAVNIYCGWMVFVIIFLHINATRIEPIQYIGYNKTQLLDGSQMYLALMEGGNMKYILRCLYMVFLPAGIYHTFYSFNLNIRNIVGIQLIDLYSNIWFRLLQISIVITLGVIAGYSGYLYEINITKEQRDLYAKCLQHVQSMLGGG